jgi:hypothetical protein
VSTIISFSMIGVSPGQDISFSMSGLEFAMTFLSVSACGKKCQLLCDMYSFYYEFVGSKQDRKTERQSTWRMLHFKHIPSMYTTLIT